MKKLKDLLESVYEDVDNNEIKHLVVITISKEGENLKFGNLVEKIDLYKMLGALDQVKLSMSDNCKITE